MKATEHRKKQLHFNKDFEDDLLDKTKQFTYRNGDRLQDYSIDDVVEMIVDDEPPRAVGNCRIVAITLVDRHDVDRYVLRYLELYYEHIDSVLTLIEFDVL